MSDGIGLRSGFERQQVAATSNAWALAPSVIRVMSADGHQVVHVGGAS